MHKGLNSTIVFITMIGLGIQLTFVKSVGLNIFLISLSLIYLLFCHINWRTFGIALLIMLPLAFGTWWSFYAFGVGNVWHLSWIYATRLIAYLFLGATLTLTTTAKDLLISLMIHLHLSSTFTYGILAAFNLLPRVHRQVKVIRYSAQLRGITYYWWQPQIYFKSIVSALHWSGDLAEAMTSHGFSEGFPRTQLAQDNLAAWQWLVCAIVNLTCAIIGFYVKPW